MRALDYFREVSLFSSANGQVDEVDSRLEEAVELVRVKWLEDGKWPLDWSLPEKAWLRMDEGPGKPSVWVTLRAMRVLKWWDERRSGVEV